MTSEPGGEQPLAQHLERVLVGDVERDVVELDGAVARPARGLGERLGALDLEERDGVAAVHLEEVVAHRPRHRGGGQAHAEHAHVEADGRVHVGRDQREVVDALPARCLGQFVGHGINRRPEPRRYRRLLDRGVPTDERHEDPDERAVEGM